MLSIAFTESQSNKTDYRDYLGFNLLRNLRHSEVRTKISHHHLHVSILYFAYKCKQCTCYYIEIQPADIKHDMAVRFFSALDFSLSADFGPQWFNC